jgi:hypothetical protein
VADDGKEAFGAGRWWFVVEEEEYAILFLTYF